MAFPLFQQHPMKRAVFFLMVIMATMASASEILVRYDVTDYVPRIDLSPYEPEKLYTIEWLPGRSFQVSRVESTLMVFFPFSENIDSAEIDAFFVSPPSLSSKKF